LAGYKMAELLKPLIVICGPTATGKTKLSVSLAKIYNGEVVSADSMQIYSGMDVGTAKPTESETDGIVHHMISVVEPEKDFNVAEYVKLARENIENICEKGKLPFLVGGTGLYISSIIEGIEFSNIVGDKVLTSISLKISNSFISIVESKLICSLFLGCTFMLLSAETGCELSSSSSI